MKTKALLIGAIALFYSNSIAANLSPAQQALQASYASEAQRDYAGALQPMEALLRQEPRNYFYNLRSAWLSYAAGSYERSLTAYQEAATLEPKGVEAELGGIKAAMALGKWDSVEKLAKSVLATDDSNYSAISNLAYSYFVRKDYAMAAKYYDQLLTLYPSDSDMKNGLAWSYFYQGRKSEAKNLFQEVLQINPDNQSANQGAVATSKQ